MTRRQEQTNIYSREHRGLVNKFAVISRNVQKIIWFNRVPETNKQTNCLKCNKFRKTGANYFVLAKQN